MYNPYNNYSYPNYRNMCYQDLERFRRMYPYKYFYPMYNSVYMNSYTNQYPYDEPYSNSEYMPYSTKFTEKLVDYGPEPFAININKAAMQNDNYRTALWTGDHLQLTLMSLKPGEDIGTEIHPTVDQFIRIENGHGLVRMGENEDLEGFKAEVFDDFIFIVPANTWHNLYNIGDKDLKLYSIYAPPNHPHGTVQKTKEEALKEKK